MRVKVYRNLNKKCWSIKCGKDPVYHADELYLKDCICKVSLAGRERVIKERRKNVHAYITGKLINYKPETKSIITYDPYVYPYFYDLYTDKEIKECEFCIFTKKGYVVYG